MLTCLIRFALALACASACATLPAQTPSPVPMPLHPLGPGAYAVEGQSALGSPQNQNFISNAGFVITSAGVVVVDGLGSPTLARRLLAHIRQLTPLPVTHVIVTHYHADHIYGLQVFQAQGAKVLAHGAAREYLHSDTAQQRLAVSREELAPWVDAQTRLVPADEWLSGSHDLVVGDTQFQIRPVGPAHTPEDLVVYVPRLKLLFAGDLVFRGRIPFVGQANSRQWIAALDTLLGFGAQVVVPGHGPLSQQVQADLHMTRRYLAHLRQTMGEAARNMDPFDEAYRTTDWSEFEHLPLFKIANRMNAYNTYLLMERDKP